MGVGELMALAKLSLKPNGVASGGGSVEFGLEFADDVWEDFRE